MARKKTVRPLPGPDVNHPNRSTWRSDLPEPTPEAIRAARGGLTQSDAAALAGTVKNRWAEYESGVRRPHWGLWEMFLLRTDQHPTHRLQAR